MKRHGQLWDELISFPHLLAAALRAARGKRRRSDVARFWLELEKEVLLLQEQLATGTYRPGGYRTFLIREPKLRTISAAPFRDRVVHHALVGLIEPIFDPSFVGGCCASRTGKGSHFGVDRCQRFSRRFAYVLKCDVRKFFPSIDHGILKNIIRRKIKDDRVLNLADLIIDGSNRQEEVDDLFPGDDLFTRVERRRGLPLGNQTSQFFANVYLSPFDHWVEQELHAPGYTRYVDDFIMFADSPETLADWKERIRVKLHDYRLTLHPAKSAIVRVQDGVRFLGYRVFPLHRRLPRASVQRMRKRLKLLRRMVSTREISWAELRGRVAAWIGHACTPANRHCGLSCAGRLACRNG